MSDENVNENELDEDLNETDIEQNEDEPTGEDLSEIDPKDDQKPGGEDEGPTDPPEDLEEDEGPRPFEEIPESKAPHFGVKDSVIVSDGATFKVFTDEDDVVDIDLDVVTLLRIALNKVRKAGNVDAINKINDALSGICSALK
jgi:hypothetical protein